MKLNAELREIVENEEESNNHLVLIAQTDLALNGQGNFRGNRTGTRTI
jgi:hypothetical protein